MLILYCYSSLYLSQWFFDSSVKDRHLSEEQRTPLGRHHGLQHLRHGRRRRRRLLRPRVGQNGQSCLVGGGLVAGEGGSLVAEDVGEGGSRLGPLSQPRRVVEHQVGVGGRGAVEAEAVAQF